MKFPFLLNLILISLFCSLFVHGQDKPFALFTEDDGLADNDVRDIVKDKEGYLWIGTSNGLSKYDGQNFTNFQVRQGLPGKWVWSVEKDDQNRIYAGCYGKGLAIIENNKVTKVLHIESSVKDKIRKLHFSDFHKVMLVGTDYGIYALKDTTFTLLSYPNKAPTKSSILSIVEYKGIVYFTVHNSVYGEGGFYKVEIDDNDLSKSKVTKILGSGQGFGCTKIDDEIFVAVNYDIYCYSPVTEKLEKIAQMKEQFSAWALGQTSQHEIGIGGFGENQFLSGLKVFNIINRELVPNNYTISFPSVNVIYYDNELNCPWICSTEGLYCLDRNPFSVWNIDDQSVIKDITVIGDSLFALTDNNVWKIKDKKVKLFKTYSEFSQIISQKANDYFHNKDLSRTETVEYNFLEIFVHGKTISPLYFIDDNDQSYLVTSFGTISFPDFSSYLPIPHGHFVSDSDLGYTLWIPNYDNIHYFQSINTSMENPYFQTNQGVIIKDVFKILKSGKLTYFASTFNGLYALKGKDGYNLNPNSSKFDNNLSDIDIDNRGNLWSTSFDGKLYQLKFDNELQIVKIYDNMNSQIIGNSYKWLKFSKNYLYIGTNKGLNKIPISQLGKDRIDTLFFCNKFNGYDFISAESAKTDSLGNLFLFTPHQVIKISNDTFIPKKLAITFQGINIDGKDYSFEQLNKTALSSSTKNINIGFNILKYPRSNNVDYQYKVNDNDWERGNSIILQSLKSGDYIVTCQAIDKETSNSYQREVTFHINTPFWLSIWFIAICVILLVLLVYWAISYRFNQQKQKQEEKNRLTREIADLHIQSLQSQMNPHFVFNSLNSIQNFILLNKPDDAIKYLGTLGGIIRMNLEYISEEYISLSDEIRFLEKYLEIEKMRFKEILNATIKNNVPDSNKTFLPPMLIQPLIENSIKHGIRSVKYQGFIDIKFITENDLLIVTVKDNGIGRDQSQKNRNQQHKSFGLNLIAERLIRLNQKNETDKFQIHITDLFEANSPTGTKVKLTIPQFNQKKIE